MELSLFLQKAIETGAFLSAFAGIAAAVVMFSLTKKFGTGIVATGFRWIAWGVSVIGAGLIFEGVAQFLQIQVAILTLIKEVLLLLGTYIIVIGTKLTADKLEQMLRPKADKK